LQKLLDLDLGLLVFCSAEDLEAKNNTICRKASRGIFGQVCLADPKRGEDLLEQGKRRSFVFGRPKKKISFNDVVRGKIDFDGALIGDFVIAKDLDNALYNFIVVVDDLRWE